jgi:hypothetical protein
LRKRDEKKRTTKIHVPPIIEEMNVKDNISEKSVL